MTVTDPQTPTLIDVTVPAVRLNEDWRHILTHAWSLRFMALAAVLSGIEVTLQLVQPYVGVNPVYLSAAAGVAASAAFVARLVAQRNFDQRADARYIVKKVVEQAQAAQDTHGS